MSREVVAHAGEEPLEFGALLRAERCEERVLGLVLGARGGDEPGVTGFP
ncbi:hypothetical protein [Streptomyces sp. SPB78]|nr:hypothetical protein [Streptomyces sp. SPB78]